MLHNPLPHEMTGKIFEKKDRSHLSWLKIKLIKEKEKGDKGHTTGCPSLCVSKLGLSSSGLRANTNICACLSPNYLALFVSVSPRTPTLSYYFLVTSLILFYSHDHLNHFSNNFPSMGGSNILPWLITSQMHGLLGNCHSRNFTWFQQLLSTEWIVISTNM